MASVCLGEDDILLPMNHLTLAEYLDHPEAQFPAEFGSRHPPVADVPVVPAVVDPPADFEPPSSSSGGTATVSALGDISDRCYHQLDL